LQQVQLERPTMKAFALHVAMQGNAPTKATALPPARLADAVLSALHAIETDLASLVELLAQPSSWVDPEIERARSIVARIEVPLERARAHVAALQSSSKRSRLNP
jgi:hypothetical protein